ncbi:MAG TPA: hypothetical protein PKY05_16960, partial [Fibrobacteria bacterium]|nr:hypothetical protein [Fibrobacteria bacterium]
MPVSSRLPSIQILPALVAFFAVSTPADFDAKRYLSLYGPNLAHEGFPHGVPTTYSWYRKSSLPTLTPPNGETMANAWGQAYFDRTFDTSRIAQVSTRVEIGSGALWVLYDDSTRWTNLQSSTRIGGGSWAEDFHSSCKTWNKRTESDGRTSASIDSAGCNIHFWPDVAHAVVRVGHPRAFFATAALRLVPQTPGTPLGSESTQMLGGAGADWRVPGGGCPTPSDSKVAVCKGIGIGRFVRLSARWRLVSYVSVAPSALDSIPMPPLEAFVLPDGSYPDLALEDPSVAISPRHPSTRHPGFQLVLRSDLTGIELRTGAVPRRMDGRIPPPDPPASEGTEHPGSLEFLDPQPQRHEQGDRMD